MQCQEGSAIRHWTVYWKLDAVSVVCSVQCALFSVQFAVFIVIVQCVVCRVQFEVFSVMQYVVYCAACSVLCSV